MRSLRCTAPSGLGGWSLSQEEKLKHLGVLLTSDDGVEHEMDRQIRASSAGMWVFLQTVEVKKELSQKAKLSIYWSFNILSLTYGPQMWIMTKRRDPGYKDTNEVSPKGG